MPASADLLERVADEVAAESACRADFSYFLTWCRIRSDDPLAPGVISLDPWPFQAERARAWQSGQSEVILKERQMGFSAVLLAPYMLWRAMYHGWACGYLSKGEDEAREEIIRIKSIYDELPSFLKVVGHIRSDDATFESGGRVLAFPSTASAGISYTLQLAIMDEAAFHPYGAANFAAIQPAASRGQFIIQSTADPEIGPSGFFHDIYWASKRGETPYKAVFVSRCRPDRDAAWYERTRSAYAGQTDRFDAYYPETDSAAFVGRSGLVYPMFDTSKHVINYDPFTWKAAKYRVGGVDFGGGDPTAVLALGVSGTRQIHQFSEFYQRGPVTVEQIALWLTEMHKMAPFARIACDPSQAVAIASLRACNLPVVAADNARDGIGLLSGMLEQGRFTIHEVCTNSITEFHGYRWAQRTDPNDRSRYATSTPVTNHADAMDARRYALKVIDGIERASVVKEMKLTTRDTKNEDPTERLRKRMKDQRVIARA